MRLIADEDLEAPIIARLRADGYDVVAIVEQHPGADDLTVLNLAATLHLLLLTADRDFGDYIFRDHLAAPVEGVVLHRLPNQMPSRQKADIISKAFRKHSAQFTGAFTVIDERGIRFRPLPSR
jgi:predicted nuclease of predicted toxin-antitoxin system